MMQKFDLANQHFLLLIFVLYIASLDNRYGLQRIFLNVYISCIPTVKLEDEPKPVFAGRSPLCSKSKG